MVRTEAIFFLGVSEERACGHHVQLRFKGISLSTTFCDVGCWSMQQQGDEAMKALKQKTKNKKQKPNPLSEHMRAVQRLYFSSQVLFSVPHLLKQSRI